MKGYFEKLQKTQSDNVIEIEVYPYAERVREVWDNRLKLDISPIYEDEEGNCYYRGQASLKTFTVEDVVEQMLEDVRKHFEPIVDSLRRELPR